MTAYSELSTPREMSEDCLAASRRLHLPDPALATRAPSIRFEDQPREVRKPTIEISDAAVALAVALRLDLE